MNEEMLYVGLLDLVYFIIIVTFHEFGHAWTASKLGDDTARAQGRVTLNPAAHIDMFGTIVLPLLAVAMMAFGQPCFFFGWGRSVPVNLSNLRHRQRDDMLISFAGPAMNLLLAIVVLAAAKLAMLGGAGDAVVKVAGNLAWLSMLLFFFNLLPVPPLDGGHIMRNLIGMSDEAYLHLNRYGFIIVLVLINIPEAGKFLAHITNETIIGMMKALSFG